MANGEIMKLDCKDYSFKFCDRELLPCVGCANRKGMAKE